MPINWQDYEKSPGDDVTATDLYNASLAVQSVIGASGVNQGFENADVIGLIPNEAFANLVNYVEISMDVYITNNPAGYNTLGFPPMSIIMPFAGTLVAITWQSVGQHDIAVFRADRCVVFGTIAASGNVISGAAVGTAPRFKKGEVLTIANYFTGTGPTELDSPLGDEIMEVPAHYSLWFLPEDP